MLCPVRCMHRCTRTSHIMWNVSGSCLRVKGNGAVGGAGWEAPRNLSRDQALGRPLHSTFFATAANALGAKCAVPYGVCALLYLRRDDTIVNLHAVLTHRHEGPVAVTRTPAG